MKWLDETPFAVFDFETTGVRAEQDRIVQVAVLQVDEGRATRGFESLVRPLDEAGRAVPVPPGAAAVHGITADKLKDAPTFPEVYEKLYDLLDGRILLGYNACHFDVPFLRFELERAGLPAPPQEELPCVDPLVVVREVDRFVKGQRRHTLGVTARRHGVEWTGATHDALTDVRITWALTQTLVEEHPVIWKESVGEYLRWQGGTSVAQERRFQSWLATRPARSEEAR